VERGNHIFCDICDEEIPEGESYRTITRPSDIRTLFVQAARDSELVPSMTQREDGTVRLDICLTCYENMYPRLESEERTA